MANAPQIDHIVVLMLENRSFDHILGTAPGVEGVLDSGGRPRTDLVNHADPTDATSTAYQPKIGAQFGTPKDQETSGGRYGGPSHSFPSGTEQLFGVKTVGSGNKETTPYQGGAPATVPVANSGFVLNFIGELKRGFSSNDTTLGEQQAKAAAGGQEDPVREVMEVFTADQLPAIHTLAAEFCVCDHWHSEVPGPTEPNRLFMHAATSTGLSYNPWRYDILNVPTIYDRVESAGRDWAMYGFDLFDSSNFDSINGKPQAKLQFSQFLDDASAGKLPFYTFLCPRYADAPKGRANSQHAPHDVRYGDKLIADIYQAVRNGPGWEKTLLIVTYDEHGGFYDHVKPPAAEAPDSAVSPNAFMEEEVQKYNKTYLTSPEYSFDFSSLGFRVPALLVSPWVDKGVVDGTVYRHTSVLRYIEDLLGAKPLTKRDATATSFSSRLSRETARTNCPTTVPAASLPADDPELYMKEPPGPKQDELTRRYTAKLLGHPDINRRTERSFPTNASLHKYICERNQRDAWARSSDWQNARFELYADRAGRWRWRLRDGSGDILAESTHSYDGQEAAATALERSRFLSNMLGDAEIAAGQG